MIWLVTGASSGLGRGIAHAVLNAGDQLAVTARDPSKLDFPDDVLRIPLELSSTESRAAAAEQFLNQFGRIDVLVNNAGHGYRAAIEESEDDKARELFETNFFGPMDLIRRFLPQMRRQGAGVIVNVTSIGAVRGALGNGYYSAAKGALELATEALQKEAGGLGIQTLLVEPGAMRTGFYGERLGASSARLPAYDAVGEVYRKTDRTDSGNQQDDPEQCGSAIVKVVRSGTLPQRLLLGPDAVGAAESYLKGRLAELQEYREISKNVTFE
ncbi:MAG: SDR family NAD(P)-dependent oxidoreductase [Acutalibacteraceae bacterium]